MASPTAHEQRDQRIATALMVVTHAAMSMVVLAYFVIYVPRYRQIFDDFGMKLPWITEVVLAISDVAVALRYLLPVAILALAVADGALLYRLRQQETVRIFSWVWFVFILLLLAGVLVGAFHGLNVPMLELFDGLAK